MIHIDYDSRLNIFAKTFAAATCYLKAWEWCMWMLNVIFKRCYPETLFKVWIYYLRVPVRVKYWLNIC